MAERDFLRAEARDAARSAVLAVESQTSAELVLTVRRYAGRYREADYLFGFLLSFVTLLAALFLPQSFPLWSFPVDVAISFLVGAWFCSRLPALRRLLTPATLRQRQARAAAQAAFMELRLSRLPARNAVFVYVAVFERSVEVLADLGIATQRLEPRWGQALAELRATLQGRPDWSRFLAAARTLGPVLGSVYPRADDDVNELPDEVAIE